MINKTISGKHKIVDKNGDGSPGKAKGPVAPDMEDALSEHTLGQYHLMKRLGRGGMATVYKAYQPSLDRYVAVKVLSTFLAQDPDFTARFHREARAIAKLTHPNILPVHDYGQEGELIYIVTRYVEGGTLQDMLGQPLDLDTTVEIIAQVGEALDYAHQQGIVHRDIKPGNILMAEGNWALLSDFGLAKMIGDSTRITKTGVGMGTPAYMAPEQARGVDVDARSDIYSLGVVLFEMLTGRVPFEGDSSLVVLLKHLTAPLPPPRGINPDIPEPVEQVLQKALAKDPIDRFQRAREMVTVLQKAVTGEPVVTAVLSLEEERRRQQEKLAALYAEAVGLLEAEEWQKALEKWIEVQAIEPGYPDGQNVAARARRGLAKLEAAVLPVEPVLPVQEETIPIWRKVPLWAWVAMGGAILLLTAIVGVILSNQRGTLGPVFAAAQATTPAVIVTPKPVSLTAGPELSAFVSPTSTSMPATPTPSPVATPVPSTASPTPTATKTPTSTAVPPTATPTHTLTPPTPTPVPATVSQLAGSIALTIYLRRTETGFVALSGGQPNGGVIYGEGQCVYGDAAVQIGEEFYNFEKPLPDPWRVEFEFAKELKDHTTTAKGDDCADGSTPGFDSKKAGFWVGILDGNSAVEGNPYSLTMKLYEGNELRESIQVFFTVADVPGISPPVEDGGKPLPP